MVLELELPMFPELDDVLDAAARVDSEPAPRPPRLRRKFVARSGSFATMEEIDEALERARNPKAETKRERAWREQNERVAQWWRPRTPPPLTGEELGAILRETARTPEEINESIASEVRKFVSPMRQAQ
jgi:uncharacterized membrane protein (UPF0182 family)